MDVPKYLQVLWSYKWLLLIGLVLAAVAGFLAGYTVVDGKVESRAERAYRAGTTLLVSSPGIPLYQAEVPGEEVEEGQTAPQQRDLTSTAVIYAYVIAGEEVRQAVVDKIGPLAEGEEITALRRTTQPGGDESFPGRLTLPILEVIGASSDSGRAELISTTATEVFIDQVLQEQDANEIKEDQRVSFELLSSSPAAEIEGSNPIIPVAVTGAGVFLLFVALAFVLYNIRSNRPARIARRANRKARRSARRTGMVPADLTPEDFVAGGASADGDASVDAATRERERATAGTR